MFLNFRDNIISYRKKFRKDTGTKLNFMNNISAHNKIFRAKRKIFHMLS